MGEKVIESYSSAIKLIYAGYILKELELQSNFSNYDKQSFIIALYKLKQLAMLTMRDEVVLEISRGLYNLEFSDDINFDCKSYLNNLKCLIFEGNDFLC